MSTLKEECGVFGIFANEKIDVAKYTYYGLFALQHRGQESCGIVVNDDGLFNSYRDTGVVNDVFTSERLESLGHGNMALGHVRYASEGSIGRNNAQPIVVNHIKGRMAIAHNGCLVNSYELRNELQMKGSIFHTTTDSEVISYIITEERLNSKTIEEAVSKAMYRLKGACSLVVMSPSKMIAVRDENGFRPLCYGKLPEGGYVVASESCALDTIGAEFVRDIKAGEIVIFDKDGVRTIDEHIGKAPNKLCIFEYVYFARPDSVIEGCNVHDARVKAGECLAEEHPVDADIVMGVPDSGLDAAIGYSKKSGIPYEIGFLKNKYIARTFIAPGQATRVDKVKIKLNPISSVVKGKRIVLIDDSIVRGTTSAQIVKLLRKAGAREIHMRLSSPPFINTCYYGTDIGSIENLIAHRHSIEEIKDIIGADSLGFLSLEGLNKVVEGSTSGGFCTACFDGKYPTETPPERPKNKFDSKISESKTSEGE